MILIKEDKELFVKDLCARLPYELKAATENKIVVIRTISINPKNDEIVHVECYHHYRYFYKALEEVKPYLFPLSSMTEEQRKEYYEVWRQDWIDNNEKSKNSSIVVALNKGIDWLNEHHFDYRGLIGKGLAIDCTNLNIY